MQCNALQWCYRPKFAPLYGGGAWRAPDRDRQNGRGAGDGDACIHKVVAYGATRLQRAGHVGVEMIDPDLL